ncbi:MAG: HAMP domain-containing protein [Myxococcaceae bacterium]|nr:HAMP domain-containing protein [Myxococcaceae bacterium]
MSLRLKLSAVTAVICLVTAVAITAGRTTMRMRDLEADLTHKAGVYAALLGKQLEPAVAYDDQLTAREVLESAGSDPDVSQVALYGDDGRLVVGSVTPPLPWAVAPVDVTTRVTRDAVVAAVRVVPKEGPHAVLYVELGTERVHQHVNHVVVITSAVSFSLALVAAYVAWLVIGIVVRRLERIALMADRIASGELNLPELEVGSPDEVGRLAAAFNVMLERIRTEQVRLAQLVEARTAELSSSREQYRQIAETTRAIPFEYDLAARRFTYVGPQCSALTGHGVGTWQEPGFLASVMEPAEHAAMFADLSAQLQKAPQYDHELRVRAADGRWVHLRSSANASGGIARGLALDVTERKALEQELQQAHRLESVGRLAAGVAHEINTPVQYSNDSVTFVRDAWVDLMSLLDEYRKVGPVLEAREQAIDLEYLRENVPKSADRAVEGLTRIADIVRSMRVFSQPEQIEATACDVREGLGATLTIAHNAYKSVADVKTMFDEVPMVQACPGDLNQVWLSLVTNAALAIGDKGDARGTITVRAEAEPDRVVVSVADTGCGIPAAVQPHIFEQFFTTRPVGKGAGQSLSAARAVVRRLGGEIWFESRQGEGTTFFVALPADGAPAIRLVA